MSEEPERIYLDIASIRAISDQVRLLAQEIADRLRVASQRKDGHMDDGENVLIDVPALTSAQELAEMVNTFAQTLKAKDHYEPELVRLYAESLFRFSAAAWAETREVRYEI